MRGRRDSEESGIRSWQALLLLPLAAYFVRRATDRSFKNEVTVSVISSNRHCATASHPVAFAVGPRHNCQVVGLRTQAVSENEPCSEFPIAPVLDAVANDHKLGGLGQRELVVLGVWRSEVQDKSLGLKSRCS